MINLVTRLGAYSEKVQECHARFPRKKQVLRKVIVEKPLIGKLIYDK